MVENQDGVEEIDEHNIQVVVSGKALECGLGGKDHGEEAVEVSDHTDHRGHTQEVEAAYNELCNKDQHKGLHSMGHHMGLGKQRLLVVAVACED